MNATDDSYRVQLSNLKFEIRGAVLLHPLTLELDSRGITGVIGQNGSGKSTLLKILARQQPASAGQVTYGGRAIDAWPQREFARRVAYLPQQTPATAGLKVRELVALGRYPWHGALGRFRQSDQAKVDEALALAGVELYADRLIDTLSGGERQRVWLAMLVAQDARLLLLDEPIAALDVAHQVEVLRLLKRLSAEKGVASVVVIHEINMAARFCDRIVALKEGRLIAYAPPGEIMRPERLRQIYDIPMSVVSQPGSGGPIAYVHDPGGSA
ncbi:MAG TPA: ATP-binding cassette domain-containing protein [Steroidobacteraceae bacterium]|nr:ATP-binding cassette domain-containing protein [Steroidobacteraceae bacterium]